MQNADESSHAGRIAVAGVVVLAVLAIAAYSAVGLRNERNRAEELASTNQSLRDSLTRLQDQLQSVTSRLDTIAEPKTPPALAQPKPAPVKPTKARAKASNANDLRLKQMQDRIADQQKQIDSTQQDLASTRDDVNGRLNSTRGELGGSIAKTHDELLALERRGERSYFEFQLGKSKQFQRVGSLSLSVRKVDSKHRSYDLSLLVNDQKLDKKHVNLYEPISVRMSDQPVELVVNEIGNNQIKGYVSEPKYKPAPAAPSLSSSIKTPADQ
jgi:septal ring factor EnvC (AmiA/AmiB activator)